MHTTYLDAWLQPLKNMKSPLRGLELQDTSLEWTLNMFEGYLIWCYICSGISITMKLNNQISGVHIQLYGSTYFSVAPLTLLIVWQV